MSKIDDYYSQKVTSERITRRLRNAMGLNEETGYPLPREDGGDKKIVFSMSPLTTESGKFFFNLPRGVYWEDSIGEYLVDILNEMARDFVCQIIERAQLDTARALIDAKEEAKKILVTIDEEEKRRESNDEGDENG